METSRKRRLFAALWCLLCAAAALAVCSRSSPLYPTNDWGDANIYFTIGRGMLETYNQIANATTGDMAALDQAIAQSSANIVKASGDNQAALEENVAKMQADYQNMVVYIAEHWNQMSETERNGWASLLEQQRSALETQVNEAREGGVQIPTAIGTGMNEGAYQLTGSAQQIYMQLMQELMPGVDAAQIGAAWDFLVSNGIITNAGTVNMAAASVADGAQTTLDTTMNDGQPQQTGATAAQGVAEGITSQSDFNPRSPCGERPRRC